MCKVIAIANQKGGVGKTTTTSNLGIGLARIGKKEVPFLIRNYSDDEATIIMVDSNIQREDILPSEKAFAYQMKNEALKHQGKKNEKSTYELVGEKAGDNAKTVQRYIRLTKLIPQLLELVDAKKLGFIAGAELSFLNESEQGSVYQWMQQTGKGINVNQAESLKKSSQTGMFDDCFKRIFLETLEKKRDFQLKAKWRNEFFEELRQTVKFKKWFFGHFHENKNVTADEILIYEQIIRVN